MRRRVNKRRSARKFRAGRRKTRAENLIARGGYHL